MTQDGEYYLPASNFLVSLMNEEIRIDETEFGRANLQLLMALTKDTDRSNRDWAAMLLGHNGPQTDEVRDALLHAADDEDQYVRGEAIQALVERDRAAAFRLVKRELEKDFVCVAIFDAAAELAEPSLVTLLEPFAEPSGDDHMDSVAKYALTKCEDAKRGSATHSV